MANLLIGFVVGVVGVVLYLVSNVCLIAFRSKRSWRELDAARARTTKAERDADPRNGLPMQEDWPRRFSIGIPTDMVAPDFTGDAIRRVMDAARALRGAYDDGTVADESRAALEVINAIRTYDRKYTKAENDE